MSDSISRQTAIDAIEAVDWYHQNKNGEMVHGANSAEDQAWYKAEDIYAAIDGVPSAQPVEDIRAMCGECDAWNQYKNYPQPGWTYIEEALPKTIINEHTHDYQEYNCLCDFGDNGFDVRTYKFGNGHFWNGGGIVDKYVTAWQPLPKIPDALTETVGRRKTMMKWEAEKKGYSCNDCYLAMQNCHDKSICCEDETGLCDWFEELPREGEQDGEG